MAPRSERPRTAVACSCGRSTTRCWRTACGSRSGVPRTTISCCAFWPARREEAMRKVLFVDRDGTLIEDGTGKSPPTPGDVRLMRGVIPALLRFKAAGYELVIVTNQGGLGLPSYPREPFERVDAFLHGLLASQGIEFAANFICPHPAEVGCVCRKPAIGLVRDYVNAAPLDRERSAVVGDRDTDVELARNLGLEGYKIGSPGAENWAAVAHAVLDRPRVAEVTRRTRETDIRVRVDLDSETEPRAKTGLGFFD